MALVSIGFYVLMTIVSQNVLGDTISALGLMIAFYYGLTGFACVWWFRRDLRKGWPGPAAQGHPAVRRRGRPDLLLLQGRLRLLELHATAAPTGPCPSRRTGRSAACS